MKKTSIETKKKKWKTGLYVRLSRDDGNDESYSVKNQKARLTKFVEENQDLELYKIYVDDGYTGTDSNRESFQQMLQDIRDKKINTVVVKDLSRLSRNYIEAGQYMEQFFIEHDVRFISLELPALDSYKNPEQMNSIVVPIQNVFNDEFCRQTSIKIRSVFDTKRRNGDYIGSFCPYGYIKDPNNRHHLIIDEEAAEVVRNIFSWYVFEGLSKYKIVYRLNELGIPNPAEYKKGKLGLNYHSISRTNDGLWSFSTIREMLRNQMYLGHMVQGRSKVKSYKVHKQVAVPQDDWIIVPNTHEPIISEELFEKARIIQERDTRIGPGNEKIYKWAGLLRCKDCDMSMIRNNVKGRGDDKVYYGCSTYRNKSKDACTKHTIRADRLENAVLKAVQLQIQLVSSMADIIASIEKAPQKKNQAEKLVEAIEKLKKDLNIENSIADSLYLDWKRGHISEEQFLRLKDDRECQIEKIKQSIAKLEDDLHTIKDGVLSTNSYLEHFMKYHNINELTRETLVDLVDMIYIHEGGAITIDFKFKDQYNLLLEYIESNNHQLKLKP